MTGRRGHDISKLLLDLTIKSSIDVYTVHGSITVNRDSSDIGNTIRNIETVSKYNLVSADVGREVKEPSFVVMKERDSDSLDISSIAVAIISSIPEYKHINPAGVLPLIRESNARGTWLKQQLRRSQKQIHYLSGLLELV